MYRLFRFIFLFSVVLLVSCGRSDRIDHEDNRYIYVWQYDGEDSTLVKFSQPVFREFKVMGGHHTKMHHIRVDWDNNGYYDCHSISSDSYVRDGDRCRIVDKAEKARYNKKPLIGIFKEEFYPYHRFHFIRYK
jgi:hypothetical protein